MNGTFADALAALPMLDTIERARDASPRDVEATLARAEHRGGELEAHDFAALISPAALPLLERAARAAHRATAERFGKTILLYAPLYLSNECVSTCVYCGFSRENAGRGARSRSTRRSPRRAPSRRAGFIICCW